MQSTHSPKGKGKGRAGDEDYAQSFASLSLSGSYGSSYADVYGSSYEQPYIGDTQGWTAQSEPAPMQSLSATYGSTPGYGNSYSVTPATSLTQRYGYQSHPSSTSNYSGYYNTTSVTSSTVPSSYEGSSVSDWSETHSRGTTSTAFSVPSTHSNWTDVNNTINRQHPPTERYQLPCEFRNLTGCSRVFPGDDVQDWIDHIEGHLQGKFPMSLRCWFCKEHQFDARETSGGDIRSNFNVRMHHIRHHIIYEGYRPEQMQKDGYLIQHLLDHNIIDRRTYQSIVNPTALPPIPGRGNNHRRLPKVEEEAVAELSPKHRRENEVRMPGTGPALREGGSKRVRQNRRLTGLIPAPAVVHPDDAVLRPLGQLPSLLHSSLKMLENLSTESSSISSRNSASQHPEYHSIGQAGDETLAKAATNDLQQMDTELVREATNCSPEQIESPQLQDHSNDRPPSYSTDTSTPESGSFWLAEYSEDEDEKLDEDHLFIQFRGLAVERVFEAFRSWKGDRWEEDLPCDGVGESDPASKQDNGKGKASATGKRTQADQSESSKTITSNSGSSSNRVGCNKRRRTSDRQLTFACPYTKKDSMSYRDCYKYKLSRIRDVKQHLARCHRNPLYCPRCMGTFETEEERDEHIRAFSCPSRPWIRLDGVTESQRRQLSNKSASNTSPEAQWFVMFDIVFPGHEPRPKSPYIDNELLQDITLYQDFLTSQGPRILSGVLAEQGHMTWNLPNGERDLAAFQQTVFEEGLGIIFEQWLARQSNSRQDSNVPSGSGSSGQNTPPSSSNSREGVGPNAVDDSRAVPPVTVGSPPHRGPLDALPEGEDIPENTADHFSFGERSDGTFFIDHDDVELPAGSTCDADEMMRLFMDDAQASSEFPPDLR